RLGGSKTREQPVIAPARDKLALVVEFSVVQLEHKTGVVIEPASEGGREADARNLHALRREKSGAAFEQVERRADVEIGLGSERTQRVGRLVGIAADGKELLDQRARGARQARTGAERGLFEKTVCDFANRPPADRV